MDKIIVYVDDAAYARQQLAPMMMGCGRTQWVLVACAPRLTQRVSKYLSHTAREHWRRKWAAKVFDQLQPDLLRRGDAVHTEIATGPLPALTESLQANFGPARVLDARRPKFGHDLAPVAPGIPQATSQRWAVPGAVASLGAVIVLAVE